MPASSGEGGAISLEYLKLIRRGFNSGQYYGVYTSTRNGRTVYHGVNIDALITLVNENRFLNDGPNYFDLQLQNQNDLIVLSRQEDVDLNPVEMLSHGDRMENGEINRNMLVFIHGPEGGHAMAYRVFSSRIRFFDPNYGEYNFNSPDSFMNFSPIFYRQCMEMHTKLSHILIYLREVNTKRSCRHR